MALPRTLARFVALQFLLTGTLLGALAGCNKQPFELAQVKGTVTIDGSPLPQGRVVFAPVKTTDNLNAGKPAFGVVHPDGSFQLSTYGTDDGAVVGEHVITVFDTSPKPRFTRLKLTARQQVSADQENVVDIALTTQDINQRGVLTDHD